MKKYISLLIVLLLLVNIITSCTINIIVSPNNTTASNSTTTITTANTTTANTDNIPIDTPKPNPTEILSKIWDNIPFVIDDNGTPNISEDDSTKFIEYEGEKYHYFLGGFDLNTDEFPFQVEGAPGNFMLDGEMIDSMLGYPASRLSSIDSASSLQSALNTNFFTCGAYHIVDGINAIELATAIEENLQNRSWTCGSPDKIIIIYVPGNYLISIFGQSMATIFANYTLETIEGAQILINNPIR